MRLSSSSSSNSAVDGTVLDTPSNQGRLSRWFSIRRGSTHQYDVDSSSDTISVTSPTKAPQMPQLCEVTFFMIPSIHLNTRVKKK